MLTTKRIDMLFYITIALLVLFIVIFSVKEE
jgi:hypothetical protein